jgi:hypothetical protein
MPNVPFAKSNHAVLATQQLQANIAASIGGLQASAIVSGVGVTYTAPVAGIAPSKDFIISHNLGRLPAYGALPCLNSSANSFYVSQTVNSNPKTQLILQSINGLTGGSVVSFWVF